MFTGLVLGIGEVTRVIAAPGGPGEARLRIRPLFAATPWVKGESIAVNGACLSVEHFDAESFTVYASRETLSLTTLSTLRQGSRVNLERALALGDRLGGHLVSGHVDGIAHVESAREAGSSRILRLRFPEEFSAQVIPKGSVALDGVSLTVNNCGSGFLEVNVIPETLAGTTIGQWSGGRAVNFESDLIGKYVERMLGAWKDRAPEQRLTLDFLRENGF
ncbi:riboflavin synthase [Desulfovibrio sp. OttesenSCG-928-A18]|nr:riboflavin synthase [Desulfovibrio sp. OttesenSCG-928-A18]